MATKYWVGGGTNTNWDSSPTTNWANTSGGAGNQTAPTTGDAVVFDAASGAGTSVCNNAISLIALDCNGFTGTLTQSAVTVTISGNDAGAPASNTLRLSAGMTYTPAASTRIMAMTGTTGTSTITTNGKTLGSLTLNGTGGNFVLADALTCFPATGAITHTAGTFDAATNNVSVTTGSFAATGAGTRTLNMGSNTWTMNAATATAWDLSGTNITFNAGTSTLLISATPTASRTVNLGTSRTYSTLTIAAAGGGAFEILLTATTSTITTWNITPPMVVRVNVTSTFTVTNALNWPGTASAPVVVNGSGGVLTISSAANSTVNWAALGNLTYSGGGALVANNSFSLGGNTGVSFTNPALRAGFALGI